MNKPTLREFRQELISSAPWILHNAKRCAIGLPPEKPPTFVTGSELDQPLAYNEKVLGELLKAITKIPLNYVDDTPQPFKMEGDTLLEQYKHVYAESALGRLPHSEAKQLADGIANQMDKEEQQVLLKFIKVRSGQ